MNILSKFMGWSDQPQAVPDKPSFFTASNDASHVTTERGLSDEQVLQKLFSASNGGDNLKLYSGDTSAYADDHSAADLAFVSRLAFYTQQPEQIDCIFRQSRLLRDKWDDKHSAGGETYGEMTIQKALNGLTDTYSQQSTGNATRKATPSKISSFPNSTTESPRVKFKPITITAEFMTDIAKLEKRQWIIEKHLLRGYVSAVFSPGAVGKSSFELAKAVSVASGRDILGLGVEESCNVLLINNEDDEDEIFRRLAGLLLTHNINPADLEEKLFIQSGYGSPLVFVNQDKHGEIIVSPSVQDIEAFVKKHSIGFISVDPFISTHTISENDNTGIDKVITEYKRLAHITRCAVSLVHHTRKQGNDSEAGAGDAESGRGASSLKDAARCVDTLARMSEKTAKNIKFDQYDRVRHIRLDTGKLNYQLMDADAKWYRMESVYLPNGDDVGTIKPVNLDPYFERAKQDDSRVKWTPTLVAEALHKVMRGDEIAFGEIIGLFMEENNVKERQARACATMISNDHSVPTRIKIGITHFDYWYSKASKTSPIIIHRRSYHGAKK